MTAAMACGRSTLAIGLVAAVSLAPGFAAAQAQSTHHDHASHHQEAKPAPVSDHSGMDHPHMDPPPDHARIDHPHVDHPPDHSTIDHPHPDHPPATRQDLPPVAPPREPIPAVTPADRAAAFRDLDAHTMHGESIHSYWALDRLEAWDTDGHGSGMAWEAEGWVGSDLHKALFRSEGERHGRSTESADVELLYGRAIAPWWDAVAGVRHGFGAGGGPSRTYAALGLTGLAPYRFEIAATAYLGESGQLGIGAEAEYEVFFTNRLIGQWLVEGKAWSTDDPAAGIGSGLARLEAGFRLRYEFHRQFAPYVGVIRERVFGGTADLRRAQSDEIDDTRVVAGIRIWF